jgi:integrase/recombinase XerC
MTSLDAFPAPVALPPVTGVDAIPLPADRHPVAVYLASHAPKGRHALRHALALAARLLTGGRVTAEAIPWHELRYQHMQALRSALLDARRLDDRPHAPATANLALTAVRGVLREATRLGLMTREEEFRARDVKAMPGRRLPAAGGPHADHR